MSNVSDRARDFWDRISPRERAMVILLAVCTPIILAVWLGIDRYRGLGHRVTERYLVSRNGSLDRARVVLDDDGRRRGFVRVDQVGTVRG